MNGSLEETIEDVIACGKVCLVVLDNDGKVKACPIDEIRNCTIVKEDITPKRKQHRSEEQ